MKKLIFLLIAICLATSTHAAKKDSKTEFDKIRESGRVYATLVMDTDRAYNGAALKKIKENDNKFAGLNIEEKADREGLIKIIILTSPVKGDYTQYMEMVTGNHTDRVDWSLEKIVNLVKKYEEKYEEIDYKQETQIIDVDTVRNLILGYHNERLEPSQADYNLDFKNAQAIENVTDTITYTNSGDKIVITIKACLAGWENTNTETHINDIYQNSLRIEYISKTLLEKDNAQEQEEAATEEIKKQNESAEMNLL